MRRALATLVAVLGCTGREPLPGPDVVARVAGHDLPHARFVAYLEENLGESEGALESEALSALFDQFLDETLLARWAKERGLVAGSPGSGAAVAALLAADPAPPLTESAIVAYYAEHRGEFRLPERLELRVIRCDERTTAERARRELRGGAEFTAVARRHSNDPTAEIGGDQGELTRDELPPAFADAILRLEPGAVSEVLAGDEGFYLFSVGRRIPEHALALDEVREEILRRLGGARADRAYARFIAEARSRYAVQVFDRNLPFVYGGKFPVSRPYESR